MPTQEPLKDYDAEPVVYCARCYSLKIKYEEAIDTDCCMECGCSDIRSTTIDQWESLYENRYKHKYVVKSKDPKKDPIYRMPLDKLKIMVFEDPSWRNIIRKLYPGFPVGFSKSDSIILLFDKLIKDGRLDELKMILIKRRK